MEALQLRVAEAYVEKFGELAKANNTMVLPANLADVGSMIALAMGAIKAPGADAKARIPVREAGRPFVQE
jgi:hypothetical protein